MKYTAAKLCVHKYLYKSDANKAGVCSARHLPTLYMHGLHNQIKASSIVSTFFLVVSHPDYFYSWHCDTTDCTV